MSTTRLHHPLPAPVVHAGFSVPQSKSHVLAGVQDAYWSDDEVEDAECPLCLEEMDISDLNFKPCVCGYQICLFCWHHIKENLNKRCPACRRVYTDDAVEFNPIAPEDHKRLTQQKKQRDRERKELETLGRKHLANVRVVQRNVVYVVGIGPRFAKEELIPTLRSTEYFGQYGKISKILLVKRSSPGGGPVVGLYVTYHRKEDAGRCITAVDGVQSPGGGRDIMRASHGTTKYCLAFLRGVPCNDHSCMNLHEWGDEKDYFTKEDLATLKHTIKATETRSRTSRKLDEDAGLPRAASWAHKGSSGSGATMSHNAPSINPASRQNRRSGTRQQKTLSTSCNENRLKTNVDRKAVASTSRPSTPAPSDPLKPDGVPSASVKQKEVLQSNSPAPSLTTSEPGSIPMEPALEINVIDSVDMPYRALPSSKPVDLNGIGGPPGLPNPSGLSAPPGLPPRLPVPIGLSPSMPTQSWPLRSETESPQTPLLASQTSYQMSVAARALVEDVKARRGSSIPLSSSSPFPDFDRTLQTLSGDDGGFSFNLDPKLADQINSAEDLPEFDLSSNLPFRGSYMDAFPALRVVSPQAHSPSLSQAHGSSHAIYDPSTPRRPGGHYLEQSTIRGSSYVGSFNPFSDSMVENIMSSVPHSEYSPLEEERKVSRFGFARGRRTSTAASSPLQSISPLTSTVDHHPFHQNTDDIPGHIIQSWQRGYDVNLSLSRGPTTVNQAAQVQPILMQAPSRFPSIDSELSEVQLRNFILSSQEGANGSGNSRRTGGPLIPSQPFEDPAIMSASYSIPANQESFIPLAYGPPPGLSAPQRPVPPSMLHSNQGTATDSRSTGVQISPLTSTIPPSLLSIEDFPALIPSASEPFSDPSVANTSREQTIPAFKVREKMERKVVKRTTLVQKVAEKEKITQSKVGAKMAVEVKVAREQTPEGITAFEINPIPESASTTKQISPGIEEFAKNATIGTRSSEKKSTTQPGTVEKTTNSRKASKGNNYPSAKRNVSSIPGKPSRPTTTAREASHANEYAITQVPLLSKKPKKSKPIVNVKPHKVLKEDDVHEEPNIPADSKSQVTAPDSSAGNSRSQSRDQHRPPISIQTLLEQLDAIYPVLELANHPFFDPSRFTSPVKISLEYGPLVHALSALSVGGGSFANSIPSASIDNAVSSFQQLLETLTQTISDLLRLLPRTTWDDSSSFDGVLRDMLKGDDFLEDRAEDTTAKEDEVAALTLALERRARWMEVQLAKLEELHRDINTAAVRAILCFNDSGWDRHHFLPRNGHSLARYSAIGTVEEDGVRRAMTAEELEKKLVVAQEAAVFAETELRESMAKFQILKPPY